MKLSKGMNDQKKVLMKIDELDAGPGVSIQRLYKECGMNPAYVDKALEKLLDEGVVYEPFLNMIKRRRD